MNLLDRARRSLGNRPATPAAAQAQGYEVNEVNEKSPPAWDHGRADRVLADLGARLERTLAPGGEADSPARRNVLAVYAGLAAGYHRRRDPLLWDVPAAVERLLADWKVNPKQGGRP